MRIMLAAVPAMFIACVSGQALASKMVIGGGQARQCYLDAENERPSRMAIEGCTSALETEALAQGDVIATIINRGILYMQSGDYAQAIANFDRASAIDANEPEAYLNKAVALFRTEDRWRECLPLFDKAIAMKTRKPEVAYFGRGLAHELAGDLRAAYDDLRAAQAIAPQWDMPAKELARYQVVPKGKS